MYAQRRKDEETKFDGSELTKNVGMVAGESNEVFFAGDGVWEKNSVLMMRTNNGREHVGGRVVRAVYCYRKATRGGVWRFNKR